MKNHYTLELIELFNKAVESDLREPKVVLDFEELKSLVENKADVNVNIYEKDYLYHTPLYTICRLRETSPNLDIVKFLVENKAEINARKDYLDSPLCGILENKISDSTLEIVKYLLDQKAELEPIEMLGDSAIYVACRNEDISLDIIKILVEYKADVKQLRNDRGTNLMSICEHYEAKLDIIEYLVENKVNPNLKCNSGNDAIFNLFGAVCRNGDVKDINLDIVNFLLENIVDVNAKFDSSYKNYLYFSCSHNEIKFDVVKCLVENKAQVNANFSSASPLYALLTSIWQPKYLIENLDKLKYLIENKADVTEDYSDNGPVFKAHHKGPGLSPEVIKCIFDNACDLKFKCFEKSESGVFYEETGKVYKDLFVSLLNDSKPQSILPFLLSLKVLEKDKSSDKKLPKPIKHMIIKFLSAQFVLEKFKEKFTFKSDAENLSKAIPLLENGEIHVVGELFFNPNSQNHDLSIGNFVSCCLTGKALYEN